MIYEIVEMTNTGNQEKRGKTYTTVLISSLYVTAISGPLVGSKIDE